MKELVGQGKPFYSAVDKAAGLLKRKAGTGSEFMKELMALPGIKQSEIAERGLGDIMGAPKMTHEQFMAALAAKPAPAIREKVFKNPSTDEVNAALEKQLRKNIIREYKDEGYTAKQIEEVLPESLEDALNSPFAKQAWMGHYEKLNKNPTQHDKYTLPGGENYREMLIKAPKGGEEFGGVGAHFKGEPGILASMRLKDRTGPNGEKLLHLEELQSDWHQQGREKGYRGNVPDLTPEQKARVEELGDKIRRGIGTSAEIDESKMLRDQMAKKATAVPDAPFKKNWEEMALKRLIHHAAEKGYHGIVVTPGAEQADRYGLAKHIGMMSYNPEDQHFQAFKPNRETAISERGATPERVSELVGKELAQKLMSAPKQMGHHYIEGEDIKVGGEGMKGFYDKKVPNILNSIGKKYGVKTQLHGHQIETQPSKVEQQVAAPGIGHFPEPIVHPAKTVAVHHFPITEDMRKDVLTNGLPLHREGGIIHKAVGGQVQPSINQMRMSLMANGKSQFGDIQNIGANEAPGMDVKAYINPNQQQSGVMPVGGVDMSNGQPGQQLMPPGATPPPPVQPGQPGASPLSAGPSSPAQQGPSNILQMTPQGQALNAMTPPQQPPKMAKGGSIKSKSVGDMKDEIATKSNNPKRVQIDAHGPNGIKGIVVPKHVLEGNKNVGAIGLNEMNEARAKVYGDEHRPPLKLNQIKNIHAQTLDEHFAKPVEEQVAAEQEALARLRAAKHIGRTANTLDKSEKLDTVRHEYDDKGRSYEGFAAKGVAGHALYTSGHGPDTQYQVINTCPGQTVGCGGGKDENGIIDTLRGTCFAPNAESQYASAAVRRAAHEQAKHDPAMTNDWILAHTGSLREAAENTDSKNKRLLFRPNVVDETDVSSRHVLRHLNKQRKATGLPPIVANSYGKTDELHDPENGYYVTYSNVGPKTKKGSSIEENIARDKQRVAQTILGTNGKGEDFKNEEGHVTPPKGSYMVTDVKRGSPFDKKMQKTIKYAKYWTRGNELSRLTPEEREQPDEAHYGPKGELTTPDKAHYGHTTIDGMRYEYQKQHILHPRLVQVGLNEDGTPHMIPTDSRFKDEDFLPKRRFKTKNGKNAGAILMTTPTESTSNTGHETSFTHHVNESHLAHAKTNNGEYEVDNPLEQVKSAAKEYIAPQPIKIVRKAEGGSIGHDGDDLTDDDYNAFPERNYAAQHFHTHRHDPHEADEIGHLPFYSHNAHIESAVKNAAYKSRKPVTLHKNVGTMRLELMKHNKAK